MNIENHNPASGDVFIDPTNPMSGGQTDPVANVNDPIMADIDKFFGDFDNTTSGDGKGDGTQPGGASIPATGQPQDPTKGMTPEQLAKHFQSLHDKVYNELNQIKPKYEQYKSVAEFLNQVQEDPTVKQAFLAELAPDLVKPTDPYEALQEQLKKEFGEDFTPDDDEATKPLSKSWRWYKRADDLYKELEQRRGSLVPKSLKELREERERVAREQAAAAEVERQEILKQMNWTESDWNEFAKFAPKLKALHIAKWYERDIRKRQRSTAPNLVNQFGGITPQTQPEIFEDLKKYFG